MTKQCTNKKPDGSWCGIPIEWREIEGGKKRPFEVDTGAIHNCPYWKKDPNYRSKQNTQFPPQLQKEYENFKVVAGQVEEEANTRVQIVSNKEVLDAVNNTNVTISEFRSDMLVVKELMEALSKLIAEGSFKVGNKV